MTELILIRHGETAWNAVKRLQGHIDIALNEEGERQAQALARALGSEHADVIISSDLGRAQTTAAPLAQMLDLPVQLEPRLRERCYGAFEGLLYEEIRSRHPQGWEQWQARELHARYPDGERIAETLAEFAQRVHDVLRDIGEAHPGKRVLLVSHGGVLDCAYRLATGMDLSAKRDFDVRNASINRFSWNGGLRLESWGEVGHLSASLDEI